MLYLSKAVSLEQNVYFYSERTLNVFKVTVKTFYNVTEYFYLNFYSSKNL